MRNVIVCVAVFVAVATFCSTSSADPFHIRVDKDTTCSTDCDGTSWAKAIGEISDGIVAAGTHDDVEIWVAEGAYAPFTLNRDLRIYGGFRGDESTASQSDPTRYRARVATTMGPAITCTGLSSATVLRGLYVTGRRVFAGWDNFQMGAGLKLLNSSARIVNCVFEYNYSEYIGGGVAIENGGTPRFINCEFRHNWAYFGAGAVLVWEGTPTFENCLFYDNIAGSGGAVAIQDEMVATFVNCTFANNKASWQNGGALYDHDGLAVVRNSVFWGNESYYHYDFPGDEIFYVWSTVTDVAYSDVEGGWPGEGNINVDPQFVFALGDNYQQHGGSPCRNTGSNTYLPADVGDLDWDDNTTETIPVDLAGVARVQETTVDMGAYEYDGRPFFADRRAWRNRYIGAAPDNLGARMALRVTLVSSEDFPDAQGRQWWVTTPSTVVNGGRTFKIAGLGCGPVFVDWTGIDAVHIRSENITPKAVYKVEAVALGADLCNAGSYSAPLILPTAKVWGDVSGLSYSYEVPNPKPEDPQATEWIEVWTGPDGDVDACDIDAVYDRFYGLPPAPSLVDCDLDPRVPNVAVDMQDTATVTAAVSDPDHEYPFAGPGSCTCASGCCDYGKCCCRTGSCSNTRRSACTCPGKVWTAGVFCENSAPCPGGGGGGGGE